MTAFDTRVVGDRMKMVRSLSLVLLLITAIATSCERDPKPAMGKFNQVEPLNDAIDLSLTPSFKWSASENASSYSLTISSVSDFSNPVVIKGITSTVYTLSTPLEEGSTYYWKVESHNDENTTVSDNAGIFFRTSSAEPVPSPGITKYFVSPAGEDNPQHGTIGSPFKTLAYAATRVPASEGDTIYLTAGNFKETHPARIPLGVHVLGAGESKTILSSSGVSLPNGINPDNPDYKLWYDGSLIQLISPHRTVFRNVNSAAIPPANGNQTIGAFTIDGKNKSLKAGVWVENRNNVTMHHVTFKDLDQRGAVFGPGPKNFYTYPEYYMTGITVHNCVFLNSGKDLIDETLGNLCLGQLDGADIHHITISDTQGYGIKFMYDGYFKNTRIHDCEITLSETDSKWGEDISIELWNLGPGNEIYNITCNTWLSIVNHAEIFASPENTKNMKVHRVKMIDKDGSSSKEAVEVATPGVEVYDSYFENKGIGIAVWDMGRENITIRNNIFFNSTQKENWAGGAAVYIDNSRTWQFKNLKIFNNVFDTHKFSIRLKNSGAGIADVQIRNNIFIDAGISELESSGTNISFTHNLKYKAGSAAWNITGANLESDNISGEPLFINSGDRWDAYYKPASSSSLVIDKGIDVDLPFKGAAPDIGRYEY